MIEPVMAISNLVLTQQIYSEETNGAHAHYREPVPLSVSKNLKTMLLKNLFTYETYEESSIITALYSKFWGEGTESASSQVFHREISARSKEEK